MTGCYTRIETLRLLCGDDFWRDHWRAACSCGWNDTARFYWTEAWHAANKHLLIGASVTGGSAVSPSSQLAQSAPTPESAS